MIRAEMGAEPYLYFRELREHAPVLHLAPMNLFLISKHADVLAICRDRTMLAIDTEWHARQWTSGQSVEHMLNTLAITPMTHNPPTHAHTRSAWVRCLPPTRSLEAFIIDQVDSLLDDLATHARPVDVQQILGPQLPMAVMAHIIGLPNSQTSLLADLVSDTALTFGYFRKPSQRQRLLDSHEHLLAWLRDFVDYRRHHPDDGLISSLLAAARQPGAIPEHDIPGFLAGLLLAGFESTAATLGNGIHAFATHPEQARLLSTNPHLAANAVEEVLRWDPAFQAIARQAANPIILHDVHIPAGAVLVLLIGSANRDPDHYPEPDRFDVTRANTPSLSFGTGPHRCLGAHLARLEATTLFTRLTQRFPKLRLAGTPRHKDPGISVRTFDTLPIAVH